MVPTKKKSGKLIAITLFVQEKLKTSRVGFISHVDPFYRVRYLAVDCTFHNTVDIVIKLTMILISERFYELAKAFDQ